MEPDLSAFKFGLIACSESVEDVANGCASILHFCGYETEPTQRRFMQLELELKWRPCLRPGGPDRAKTFSFMHATPEICELYLSKISSEAEQQRRMRSIKLFQISEDDLETCENAIREIDKLVPATQLEREHFEMLKAAIKRVRDEYGPHEIIAVI
jgi:hypothetical protein